MGDQAHTVPHMTESRPAGGISLDFLAFHGGPFFELQQRLNLLHDRSLKTGRRVLLFVSLAWGAPLLLTLSTLFSDDPTVWRYLTDPGPWARFLIAIAAFVAAEQYVETGLRRTLAQFARASLIAPESVGDATIALTYALRQRDSKWAELVCLALAAISALIAYATFGETTTSTWAATVIADSYKLTAAGWWCVLVSIPLFVFLFFRGVWRHLVWAKLLRTVAQLNLRLVATHPDGNGGLSFLAAYPNAYVLFVFGVSCGVAAAVAKHLTLGGLSATTLTVIMACWLALVIGFFAYPLSAFSKPLLTLKDKTLLALAAHATAQQRAAERKMIGSNIVAPDLQEAEQAVDLIDVTKQYELTRKLSSMLVNRKTLLPVAAAALIPFAVAGATKLPYKEVFSVLKKLLLV
ncbi:MAG: hypothetical protein EOS46_17290 [Mesorhizobium sp.]|nr:MAG: hypothetical protein EOS46_17290 [Mesorhizobium sp.]